VALPGSTPAQFAEVCRFVALAGSQVLPPGLALKRSEVLSKLVFVLALHKALNIEDARGNFVLAR
jgi:hypothetical protein